VLPDDGTHAKTRRDKVNMLSHILCVYSVGTINKSRESMFFSQRDIQVSHRNKEKGNFKF
jgi:hypothetical protein